MRATEAPSPPDATPVTPDRRLASLDGLRGLAALAIFVFHGWLYTKPAPDAAARSSVGDYAVHELRLAVVVFFVLSGFLLYRPWVRSALARSGAPDLRRYLRSRVARIAPAYYAALIGSIALLWGLSDTPGVRLPPAGELPLFFVFAQNFSDASVVKLDPPMWSLVVEVCFYAALPVLGALALRLPPHRRAQALVPLGLVALGVAFNWTIAGDGHGQSVSKSLPAMAPYFGVGMLTALALHERAPGRRARRGLIAAGLALMGADALLKAVAPAAELDVSTWLAISRDLGTAVGFAMVLAAVASAVKLGVLSGRVLAGLGTISYGFYLWHVPVLLFLRGHGLLPLDPVLGTLVALGPALAISALSWVAIERPAIRWARRRGARDARRAESAPERASGGGADRQSRRPELGTARA